MLCHGDIIIELLNTDNLYENIDNIQETEQNKFNKYKKINNIKEEINYEITSNEDYCHKISDKDKDYLCTFMCGKIDELVEEL